MDEQLPSDELLNFFKALADANRLKIVGFLAKHPYTVEELAKELDLGVSTTSHHLGKLAKAGLVDARADGHYNVYSLQTDILKEMAQRLLTTETFPRLIEEDDLDTFERKVIENFIDADGRIEAFPAQEKKFIVLLRYILKSFEPGVQYSEREVNEILFRFNEDTATLRRNLVAHKMMTRHGGGGNYWRL